MNIRKLIHRRLNDIQHEQGYAYIASTNMPLLSSHQFPSHARVLEDGVPLSGPDNVLHDDIRQIGGGRYSFWHDKVYFSASDNTDPRNNNRKYEMEYRYIDGSKVFVLLKRLRNRFRKLNIQKESSDKNVPVNFGERDTSPESLQRDLEYAVQIGLNFIKRLPDGVKSLPGKAVLEIGPGINFGSTLLMATFGAKVMVSDLYLSPWKAEYHPKFYALLRSWVKENYPQTDISPIDRILDSGGYPPESIGCYSTPLEELAGIMDESVDIILSNAVFEHLANPEQAFRQLARVSKPGALGYHQVDFRDHNNFSRPLEYLLIADEAFSIEFKQTHGERGNRYRPHEYWEFFEEIGFEVQRFVPSSFADDSYLADLLPRLRSANGSKYKDAPIDELKQISGLFCLKKRSKR
ncbi:MAG: methyltransferase domain-containing protein [Anaerolineales bacterium]|nr:methyltransferase domain-containing protein [Anaerolineales bacterium]